jgi:dipeptidyl aminopeptidase/acylaminoacyl peptidase
LLWLLPLVVLLPGISSAATPHPFSIWDLLYMERLSDPRPSPDGTRFAFVGGRVDPDADSVRQGIYLGEIGGGPLKSVTPADGDADNPRWRPDGLGLYYLAPHKGVRQLWHLDLSTGHAAPLSDVPLSIGCFELCPGGRTAILSLRVFPGKTPAQTKSLFDDPSNRGRKGKGRLFDRLPVRHWDEWRDGTRNHLFVYDLEKKTLRDLMTDMDTDCPTRPFGGTEDFSLSPDGRFIVFVAKNPGKDEAWSTNTDLYQVPADGSSPPVRMTANPAADLAPRFSPDGLTLAYLAARRPGNEADRLRVVLRSLQTGKERFLDLRADDTPGGDRSPTSLAWSPDSRLLYVTADHMGQHALFALDPVAGTTRLFLKTGVVSDPRPLPDGRVLFGWESLQRPREFYVAGLDTGEGKPLTKVNDDRMASVVMGKTTSLSFKGTAGRAIYGRLIHPTVMDSPRKSPVAVLLHGGPQTSHLNEFSYRWNPQIFAGSGYAVLALDLPGSTGYGQDMTDAVSGDWGGAPYEDLMAGIAKTLEQFPYLDRSRMAALGPSYGGYLVYWLAGRDHPFRCLVSHAGVFDRQAFYYQTDELWFAEWEGGGPPWVNPEGHLRHNPAQGVKAWRTPILITHGEQDFRVPLIQSLAAFSTLQRLGVPAKLLVFPDEGHWILKPRNLTQWYDVVLAWLKTWLSEKVP